MQRCMYQVLKKTIEFNSHAFIYFFFFFAAEFIRNQTILVLENLTGNNAKFTLWHLLKQFLCPSF